MFSNADQNLICELTNELTLEIFQPDDLIIREGATGDKIYFIDDGTVQIIKASNGHVLTSLSDGSYFGGEFWLLHFFIKY